MVRFLERLRGETAICPVLQFFFGGWDDVVVETLDLDLAGSDVVEIGDKLHQLSNRVPRRAPSLARVCIDCCGFEGQDEPEQSAQARGARGPISRHPNRVRNNYGIRAQVWLG